MKKLRSLHLQRIFWFSIVRPTFSGNPCASSWMFQFRPSSFHRVTIPHYSNKDSSVQREKAFSLLPLLWQVFYFLRSMYRSCVRQSSCQTKLSWPRIVTEVSWSRIVTGRGYRRLELLRVPVSVSRGRVSMVYWISFGYFFLSFLGMDTQCSFSWFRSSRCEQIEI